MLHAIKATLDLALEAKESGEDKVILFNLCGHGHFHLAAYEQYLAGEFVDLEHCEEEREGRRHHTGLGRRKWPGSTAPSRTDEGRERIRDVRDRCVR